MENLFLKTKDKTKNLIISPFINEEEFEKTIYDTPIILEDIFFLKRQIRGGQKSGIPDILGVDSESNICIVEMKNTTVDSSIIKQVFEYAIWAENNPDSIKSLWLEKEDRPENIEINWDNFQIKIIIIAPKIDISTLKIMNKINYIVNLLEINRWVDGKNQYLLVRNLESDEKKSKIKPVSGLQVYDKDFYLNHYNNHSVQHFYKYVKEVEKLIKTEGWNLETKFNRGYCGFKLGSYNAFLIKWIGSKTFAFSFKISEKDAKKIKIPMDRYLNEWKEAIYNINPGKTKTGSYIKLFELAYKQLLGE